MVSGKKIASNQQPLRLGVARCSHWPIAQFSPPPPVVRIRGSLHYWQQMWDTSWYHPSSIGSWNIGPEETARLTYCVYRDTHRTFIVVVTEAKTYSTPKKKRWKKPIMVQRKEMDEFEQNPRYRCITRSGILFFAFFSSFVFIPGNHECRSCTFFLGGGVVGTERWCRCCRWWRWKRTHSVFLFSLFN